MSALSSPPSGPVDVWNRSAALIGGDWVPVPDSVEIEDPATVRKFGRSAACSPAEVDRAVAAAVACFPRWSTTSRADRADALRRVRAALAERSELLVEATVREVGAPVRVAREAHVGLALQILSDTVDLLQEPEQPERIANSLVFREPAGVVAAVTPWNYPLYQLVIKVAAALGAGCSIVAKPAELTPFTAYLLADAIVEADLPAGVFNLVPGTGRSVGEALVGHPDVDVVSFTGSTAVGSRIAARAATHIKRVSLELGGKSASVVLDGADLDAAVRATVESAMLNSGQTCSAWTRLLVPVDRMREAVALAETVAAGLVVGDPGQPSTDIGPLVSRTQLDTVRAMLDRACSNGARVSEAGPVPAIGHFLAPTIVSEAAPDSEIVREEVFGPVVVVQSHEGVDDAIRIANDSDYGLAGAVWAASKDEGIAVARRLRTGQVDVNGAPFNARAPFGGFKRSGYGRELGAYGIEEFTELKAVQT